MIFIIGKWLNINFKVISCKDKSVNEFWERQIVVCGSYVIDKIENMDEYFQAVGYNFSSSDFNISDYK